MLITFGRQLNFMHEDDFIRALSNHPCEQAKSLAWRLHTACWAAANCVKLMREAAHGGVLESEAVTGTEPREPVPGPGTKGEAGAGLAIVAMLRRESKARRGESQDKEKENLRQKPRVWRMHVA